MFSNFRTQTRIGIRTLFMPAALACATLSPTAFTQAAPSFSQHTLYTSAGQSFLSAHGDFNNDGREDLLVSDNKGTNAFAEYLFLSNGDGTYDAPIQLDSLGGEPYVVGDFDHDGKLDYAVMSTNPSHPTIAIYQGHGDGTFSAALELGGNSNLEGVAAADFNHDGCTDLAVVTAASNATKIQIWQSRCSGSIYFSAGQAITSGVISGVSYASIGDFDADGKADLILLNGLEGIPSTAQVFYGDGAGHLGSPAQLTDPNGYWDDLAGLGDIDSNGTSDLLVNREQYGSSGTSKFFPQIGVFKGNANRTLSFRMISVPSGECPRDVQVADFNGDGLNDLIYNETACGGTTMNVTTAADLATAKGTFSSSERTIRANPYGVASLVALKSTRGTKPDLAALSYTTAPSSDGTHQGTALVLLENTTTGSFPGCGTLPQAEGIHVCLPSGSNASTPVKFSISAAGPTPMRAASVWVDGKKASEQLTHAFSNYSFLNQSLALSAGSHAITIFGTGWDDTLQKKSFNLTVSGTASCAAPSSAGVHLCSPVNNSTGSSPLQVRAAAKITGTLARMEVWVDGTKRYSEATSTSLNTSITLGTGTHQVVVYAVNAAGTKWKAAASTAVH